MRALLSRSIPARVGAWLGVVTLLTTLCVTFVSYRVAMVDAESALARRAGTYSAIAARELGPAVAFEDVATANEVMDAMLLDPDVVDATLRRGDGTTLALVSRRGAAEETSLVASSADVRPREGGLGRFDIRLSSRSVREARRRALRTSGVLAAAACVVAVVGALTLASSLRRRLGGLTAVASAIAAGDHRRRPTRDGSADEIDRLSVAFDTMLTHLESSREAECRAGARQRDVLDDLVRLRTRELEARHREVRLLLDHISDGVVTIDAAANLGAEGARVLERWFGPLHEGQNLWSYLAGDDAALAARLELAWDTVSSDLLPLDLALEQVRRVVRIGERSYDLDVTPIEGSPDAPRFLVVVRDVTLSLQRDAAAANARELGAALQSLAHDRDGFLEQVRELEHLADRTMTAKEPTVEMLRDLHTLKGNAAMVGLHTVSALCHQWEDCIAETGELPGAALAEQLAERWCAIREALAPVLEQPSHRVTVDRGDLERLGDALRAGRPREVLLALVRSLDMERAQHHLERLADYARGMARARGTKVDVRVTCEDVGVDGRAFAPLWSSLVHVVRNALSHGIEAPEERVALGKASAAMLNFQCIAMVSTLEIAISDDGRGIDWARVREVALRRGLPASTDADLEAALLSAGFSTRTSADELAGRGQGMGAVLAAARQLGGEVEVSSQLGRGTTWSILIPVGRRWIRGRASHGLVTSSLQGAS